ncbi:Uncharacterised protein [Mycoplasmopsis arginini]|nr:Uncharacterised protein [Chlamydia abortus]SGA07683.1 Uncharacterised protein [Mycoplasmopsis arginini]SGA09445.1 Uncharacterised protein [Mycoplasmopsis arginini]SGA32051.1 Uncharacterised protein [Chlamydia abortus]
MTSINKINDKFMVIVKGAPDVLINKITLEKNNKEKVLKVNNE